MTVFNPWLCLCSHHIFNYIVQNSRFKQLKEQEERRKKQREEERRKVEAAAKELQITNGNVNKEITPLEEETSSSNIDGVSVNGNSVNSKVKVDEGASTDSEVSKEKSDTLDARKNERSSLHLDKNIEKVLLSVFIFEVFCFCY